MEDFFHRIEEEIVVVDILWFTVWNHLNLVCDIGFLDHVLTRSNPRLNDFVRQSSLAFGFTQSDDVVFSVFSQSLLPDVLLT